MSRRARLLAVRKATTHLCRSLQHRACTWGRGTRTQKRWSVPGEARGGPRGHERL